jgi:hypothetical protein
VTELSSKAANGTKHFASEAITIAKHFATKQQQVLKFSD